MDKVLCSVHGYDYRLFCEECKMKSKLNDESVKEMRRVQNRDQYLGYAVRQGYIEADEVKNWTETQKWDYYNHGRFN